MIGLLSEVLGCGAWCLQFGHGSQAKGIGAEAWGLNCGLVTGFGVSCLQMGLYPIPWHLPYNGKPRECHCSRSYTPTSCIESVVHPSVLEFIIPALKNQFQWQRRLKSLRRWAWRWNVTPALEKRPPALKQPPPALKLIFLRR